MIDGLPLRAVLGSLLVLAGRRLLLAPQDEVEEGHETEASATKPEAGEASGLAAPSTRKPGEAQWGG